jgi:hypothetical protein
MNKPLRGKFDDVQEGACPDALRVGVIPQEDRPSLRDGLGWMNVENVLLNGWFGHRKTESAEFLMNPFSSPPTIFGRPTLNQGNGFRCQWSRVSGLRISKCSFQFFTRLARRTSQRGLIGSKLAF